MMRILKILSKEELHHYFTQWKRHWSKRVDAKGDYFNDDNIDETKIKINNFYECFLRTFCHTYTPRIIDINSN